MLSARAFAATFEKVAAAAPAASRAVVLHGLRRHIHGGPDGTGIIPGGPGLPLTVDGSQLTVAGELYGREDREPCPR